MALRTTSVMKGEELISVMSGNNPGAEHVCAELLEYGDKIDPDSWHSGVQSIYQMDTLGIYGHRIWRLYQHVCHENLGKMIALLRAKQLRIGNVTANTLNYAINNYGAGLHVNDIVAEVQKRLPSFQIDLVPG